MSAESPRHARGGGPLTVPSQPPSDRSIIDAVSGFINDVTLSSGTAQDPKDVIQWARFETADINEPTPEGDSDNDISPLLLILGYGSGVQVWLIPPSGDAQEVLSWRQGIVKVLRILPSPQHGDCFASKRPLIALCDSASPGPSFCSLSFISIRGGEQVKSIKFKNPILDVLANKRSVVVSFSERFAVFDAATLEDRMTVTTCYPCPCPLGGAAPINPLALGDRWLAYADKKLNQSKRSSGGCEGEGVTSYTATVLHAAKSLSKGLRGLGESVAHSLAGGGRSTSQSPSPPNADVQQPGVVTVLDIESNDDEDGQDEEPYEPMVAHFVAHSEAIIALSFDASGMLLVTADRRGHDFHVFRINPHPCGPSLAAVHHLYILHRGDTTAKVQDIAISWDSRWAAISTLRGTTHVFAISAYGGAPCVRTHTQPRVVNRLSRFHRSAGLPIAHSQPNAKRNSASPVHEGVCAGAWFPNPRLPPYPAPAALPPLAQLRPTANLPTHTITRNSSGRQRLSSLSEDSNAAPLLARCSFGVCAGGGAPATALYLMAANGCLLHLVLHPRANHSIPKEKVCDESPIEVEVEAALQWPLQRPVAPAQDLLAPLPPSNPLLQPHFAPPGCADMCMSEEERWLSQVEIVTHAGPHRRLWMGPQFVFKTYNCTGSSSSLSEAETVDVELQNVARSNPVNVPAARPVVPVLIDSGSSSLEQSPSDGFRRRSVADGRAPACDLQLREDLAEAMREDHGRSRAASSERPALARPGVARAVDPAGCVVAEPAPRAPPPLDCDAHTRANDDEARFRPVVRAPAALAPGPPVLARPLPRGTTLPVQSCAGPARPEPGPALPLATHVLIPAALQLHAADQRALPSGPADAEARPRSNNSPTELNAGDRISSKLKDKGEKDDECESVRGKNKEVKSNVAKKIRESSVAKEIEKSSVPKQNAEPDVEIIKETNVEQNSSKDVREKSVAREIRKSVDEGNIQYNVPKEITESNIDDKGREVSVAKTVREPREKADVKNIREPLITRDVSCSSVNKEVRKSSAEDIKISIDKDVGSTSYTRESGTSSEYKESVDTKKFVKTNDSKETRERSLPKESKQKEAKRSREVEESKQIKEPKKKFLQSAKESEKCAVPEILDKKEFTDMKKDPLVSLTLPIKIESSESQCKDWRDRDIKTEEQAWDMLLNEPEKTVVADVSQQNLDSDKIAGESKPKSKKNRKNKKAQDDFQAKVDEDSFVEIHAIEDKQQPCSGDLVSISTPYEEIEPSSFYLSKTKKARSPKSPASEKCEGIGEKGFNMPKRELQSVDDGMSNTASKIEDISFDDEILADFSSPVKNEEIFIKNRQTKSEPRQDQTRDDGSHLTTKGSPKAKKSKSLSPYGEDRKFKDKFSETEVKDVYVIDTSKDDFPDIQITRGKSRKSPQPKPADKKGSAPEVPAKSLATDVPYKSLITEPPVKSWSSIAASKSVKKVESEEKGGDTEQKRESVCLRDELRDAAGIADGNKSSKVSLQDKLIELCKRTDIMVAECDAPSELNFVEEHHAVLQDLPPLEPLDFGLDDFKLEVMRDSLLDVNDTKLTSPICKINIDDILSSIKETTSRVIESSTFNLIDLEKVPPKKEKGFSVIESDKITSQEVKLDEDSKSEEKDGEVMEKSSDDDTVSPVISTDSDKDDKKGPAPAVVLPSSKQSTKSKKSRRKKK